MLKDKTLYLFEDILTNIDKSNSLKKDILIEDAKFNGMKKIVENINGTKRYYIEGIFSEFDTKNQNGRIYPRSVMQPEIIRFYEKYVKNGRAFGELNHPEDVSVDLYNVSHRIVDLQIKGNKVYGKAIIGGPKGDAVISLLEMGGVIGVSSRSLGSVNHLNEVTELEIKTWDIVHEPSVSSAIMTSFMESVKKCNTFDWLCDNTGFVTENVKNEIKKLNNNRLFTKEEREMYAESAIKDFINNLYNK